MTWLSDHVAYRRAETMERKRQTPEAALLAKLLEVEPVRKFSVPLTDGCPSVIAEIKFRSPSMGSLRPQQDVEVVAQGYHRAGASALSVLVDSVHFGGELSFLGRARSACSLPILAKGFFVDRYDLLEARVAGADAALLIARILSRTELRLMLKYARVLGLSTLTELHGEDDLSKIEGLDLDLVGVNHRNLENLAMDADLSASLASRLPAGCVRVAESGMRTHQDLLRMASMGYCSVLMGTAFMSLPDPGTGLATMMEDLHACR